MKTNYILCTITFFVLIIVFFIINLIKSKSKKKKSEIVEIRYLQVRFNLATNQLKTKRFLLLISFIDSFIISITFLFVSMIRLATIFQLLIGFVILLGLIYSVYEIIGRILVKKGYQK